MTVAQFLAEATKSLRQADIESARLDVLVLLEDTLHQDRSNILAHPEQMLTAMQLRILNKKIIQRKRHLPLAYIRGRVAFFGREFVVNTQVLVPRPETEAIIELLNVIPFSKPPYIADVGTGSGCIGITAALELPDARVHFYDMDPAALDTARNNALRLRVSGEYHISNVLDLWHHNYDIVLANLPYVPDLYPINRAAEFEPALALFSGKDGLAHYRLLWQQISARTGAKPTHVITEASPEQHAKLAELATSANYQLHTARGYAQHFTLLA